MGDAARVELMQRLAPAASVWCCASPRLRAAAGFVDPAEPVCELNLLLSRGSGYFCFLALGWTYVHVASDPAIASVVMTVRIELILCSAIRSHLLQWASEAPLLLLWGERDPWIVSFETFLSPQEAGIPCFMVVDRREPAGRPEPGGV